MCWSKPDPRLVGLRARLEPGDNSGIWQWANVGEVGAASVATVLSGCAGFAGIRILLGAQSGTMLDCGFGTKVRFVGTRIEAWVSSKGIWPGGWVGLVGTGAGVWVRFVVSGSEACVSFEGSVIGARVKFDDTGACGEFEGAGIGTRLGFGSGVERPADPDIRAKVLSPSGDNTEVGRPETLAVSKVLVRLGDWLSGLSGSLIVGVGGPDIDVILGAGVISGASACPSVFVIWTEGSFVSTLGLESGLRLQVLTIGTLGAGSSCCFMGDVVTTGRATSEPGEGRR